MDAAKGDAMASVCDIANAVEAQDVGGERAQACKDARIAADAAGVFCEATVADVVRAVFYAPVVAYGLGALSGWQNDATDEQCNFASRAPQPSDGGAGENIAIDADHRADVAVPLGVGQAVTRREYLDHAGFVAGSTPLVGGFDTIERFDCVAQFGDGVMQGRLVGFDLSDQVYTTGGGMLECFF